MTTDPVVSTTIAVPTAIDALAITVGAVSGALHARRRHLDVMGILVVAFCGALGGGVIRDILLQSGPPVFLTSSAYLTYALAGAIFGWIFARLASKGQMLLEVIDGLFIGVWVLVGATQAMSIGLSGWSVVLVAVITATGGGVLRDLFCGQPVKLLRQGQWLAAAALAGAVAFVAGVTAFSDLFLAEVLGILVASMLRMLSLAFDFRTPKPMDVSRYWTRRMSSSS